MSQRILQGTEQSLQDVEHTFPQPVQRPVQTPEQISEQPLHRTAAMFSDTCCGCENDNERSCLVGIYSLMV